MIHQSSFIFGQKGDEMGTNATTSLSVTNGPSKWYFRNIFQVDRSDKSTSKSSSKKKKKEKKSKSVWTDTDSESSSSSGKSRTSRKQKKKLTKKPDSSSEDSSVKYRKLTKKNKKSKKKTKQQNQGQILQNFFVTTDNALNGTERFDAWLKNAIDKLVQYVLIVLVR